MLPRGSGGGLTTPAASKTAKKKAPAKKKAAAVEITIPRIVENKVAAELDPYSGTHGCNRCGFDGPLLAKFAAGAVYERGDGTFLEVVGEHLVRGCQWCQRSWLERCKHESPDVPTTSFVGTPPSRPMPAESPEYG